MSFRAARHVFSATARSSVCPLRSTNASSVRMGVEKMSSLAHTPKESSDRPWIIASTLIFGPALLYLISPSARKSTHSEHHDSHDFPRHPTTTAPEPAQESEPIKLKDDEGTEVDVTESIRQAEAEDVPKADAAEPSIPVMELTSDEHIPEGKDTHSEKETIQAAESGVEGKKKSGTFQEGGEGPTDLGAARQAAKEGILPKQKAEESSSS